ncbi:MAG: hypothetical protein NTX33_00500 [Propionibacteriales bacterium]|nr:hypothetical protein [Propionibacteriales bacterium]
MTTMSEKARRADSGSGLAVGGQRMGMPGVQQRRSRSWGLVVLAALLVIGTGLAVAAYGLSAGKKASVLAVGEPIAKGQVIERDDLISVSVSGVANTIAVSDIDDVVGKTAAVDLVDKQVLADAMVTSEPIPGDGESSIGLSLDPTRIPSAGLAPGDTVAVVAVPGSDASGTGFEDAESAINNPELLAQNVLVYSVDGESTANGAVFVTLVVPAEDAARIAAYSTAGRVAVVETSASER